MGFSHWDWFYSTRASARSIYIEGKRGLAYTYTIILEGLRVHVAKNSLYVTKLEGLEFGAAGGGGGKGKG